MSPIVAEPCYSSGMAFDIANPIGTGTDAEIVTFTRAAIVQITMHGQAYSIDGRQLTRADLPSLHKQLQFFESRVNASNSTTGNKSNLARFQRPA